MSRKTWLMDNRTLQQLHTNREHAMAGAQTNKERSWEMYI